MKDSAAQSLYSPQTYQHLQGRADTQTRPNPPLVLRYCSLQSTERSCPFLFHMLGSTSSLLASTITNRTSVYHGGWRLH